MAHRGCIRVDCLPLQILLNDNPSWAGTPVAVTREQRSRSSILALNREAREKGLALGMKYASALALVPDLRAREVPRSRIAEARDRIIRTVYSFTPDIEPCPFDTGAVWVSLDGLRSMFASEPHWIRMVRGALASEGFPANVVAGFTRFGTYAIARTRSRCVVLRSRDEERALMSRSSIDILPLPQRAKSILRKLGVHTVQQFVSLPAGETVRRFGKKAGLLRQAILADDPLPIQPVAVKETTTCRRHLDAPVVDLELLMPLVAELLEIEVGRVEAERSVIAGLTLVLRTEEGEVTTDLIRPAVPTRTTSVLLRLIQLRLSARQLSSGVEDIELRSVRAPPSRRQGELFTVRRRDLDAGARAFAAIRARCGNESVIRAELRDSHLPERSYTWVPLQRPVLPVRSVPAALRGQTSTAELPTVVRRILFAPGQTRAGSTGLRMMAEPFVVSGFWWGSGGDDEPFFRTYCFSDSPAGILWLFVDRLTDRLWVQGMID